MTVGEMLKNLRANKIVDIKEDNRTLISFGSNGYEFISDNILNKEVDDWWFDRSNIFINFNSKSDEEDEHEAKN